jgi:hypothetical protein
MTVPRGWFGPAVTVPPIASTSSRTMASPNPEPASRRTGTWRDT